MNINASAASRAVDTLKAALTVLRHMEAPAAEPPFVFVRVNVFGRGGLYYAITQQQQPRATHPSELVVNNILGDEQKFLGRRNSVDGVVKLVTDNGRHVVSYVKLLELQFFALGPHRRNAAAHPAALAIQRHVRGRQARVRVAHRRAMGPVMEELRLRPPRGAFPGGSAYRNAMRRFNTATTRPRANSNNGNAGNAKQARRG